jgi:hypothetical protein
MLAAERESAKRMQLIDLEYAPPMDETYINYLPVCSPEKALKKWIRGRTDVRRDGWAALAPPSSGRYPESFFVMVNRSRHLEHLGPWLVIDAARTRPERNESALLHYPDFEDEYRRGFSVRSVVIGSERTGGMFEQEVWELGRIPGEAIMRLRPERQKFEAIGIVVEHGMNFHA